MGGSTRPLGLRAVVLAGPRDGERVAAGQLEEVAADLVVLEVEADPAGRSRAACARWWPSRARRPWPTAWRPPGRRCRARSRSCPTSCRSAAASTGRVASWPSARSTRSATPTAWRRSGPDMRRQSASSPGSRRASTQVSAWRPGPPGRSEPKNRRTRCDAVRHRCVPTRAGCRTGWPAWPRGAASAIGSPQVSHLP